jgi:transcriptional regulator with XRE-family HTH domain
MVSVCKAFLSTLQSLPEKRPYTPTIMPRKSTKTRPPQGVRLAELRKAAGLSQYELANYVGVPPANIAFWERSEKPPRSEVLSKMAEALGVSVEDLLNVDVGKTTARKATKSNGRPAGKVREAFDRVSKLPRRQQEHIVNWVSAYVSQYEQSRQ